MSQDYDDEFDDDAIEDEEDDDSLSSALANEWGSAPWYVSSVAIHALVFLILLMLPITLREKAPKNLVITDFIPEEPDRPS